MLDYRTMLKCLIFLYFAMNEVQVMAMYQRSLSLAQTADCLWFYDGNKVETKIRVVLENYVTL